MQRNLDVKPALQLRLLGEDAYISGTCTELNRVDGQHDQLKGGGIGG